MDSQLIIEMQAVTKNYPMGEVTVHALRGLDLAVTRGEFIVLLGHPAPARLPRSTWWVGSIDPAADGWW